jgi:NitT/TauT family transport system substrate-binding protein
MDKQDYHFGRRISLVVLVLAALLLGACRPGPATTPSAPVTVRVAALRGPTGIGLVGLMDEQDQGRARHNYTFYLTGTPDDIVAQLSSGQADIAALPTNLAANLYQKMNRQIRLLAINTLGVLSILEKGDRVHSLADLAGRELLATGQGATPEYVLSELLDRAGIRDAVTVTFKTEHEELATLAAAGRADLVLLPEPFVTTVLSKNPDMRLALELTEVWSQMRQGENDSELAMGCLVVTAAFAEQQPQVLRDFLAEYQTSVERVNAKPDQAGELVARYKIMADAALAARAIPNCHIVLISGPAMQPVLEPFYQMLLAANPKSIGEQLPDQTFYWLP